MKIANSMDELAKIVNQHINKALRTDVADVARDTMSDHVQSDVYDQYAPSEYQRTGNLYKDIKTTMGNEKTLVIENVARDEETGRYYAPIVEEGVGYEWKDSRIYNMQPFPRPFIKNTAIELENGKAKNALAEGLKKQGLEVT